MSLRVLVVDDSVVVRGIFARELSRDPEIEVVGTASNPYEARDKIVELKPDVITLDIEMPRMDGITFLKKLMRYYPIPVVVVSSFTEEGGERAVEALNAGGVDLLCKPNAEFRLPEFSVHLIEKTKAAARARLDRGRGEPAGQRRCGTPLRIEPTDVLVAIGASTGGPQAIQRILAEMPQNAPGILVAQHMPPGFTRSFAARLDKHSEMYVKEAEDGDIVETGKVLVAPGNYHMVLKKADGKGRVQVKRGPLVCRHRPSVDVLFKSLARCSGPASIGIVLTGMGNDGAEGLLEMSKAGAETIAQDENSCVVHGMPERAKSLGGAKFTVELERIAAKVAELVSDISNRAEAQNQTGQ